MEKHNREVGFIIYFPFIEQGKVRNIGAGLPYSPSSGQQGKKNALAQMIATPIPTLYCPSRRSPQTYEAKNNGIINVTLSSSTFQTAKTDYAACAGIPISVDSPLDNSPPSITMMDRFTNWMPVDSPKGIVTQRSTVTTSMIQDGTSYTYAVGRKIPDAKILYNVCRFQQLAFRSRRR